VSGQDEHAMIPDGHGRMVPVPGAFNPVPAVMRNLRERYGTLSDPPEAPWPDSLTDPALD
jgi:hypothetical protein